MLGHFICLSASLFVCLFVILSLWLSVSLCIYIFSCWTTLSVSLSLGLSVSLSLCLFVSLSLCLSFSLSLCLSVNPWRSNYCAFEILRRGGELKCYIQTDIHIDRHTDPPTKRVLGEHSLLKIMEECKTGRKKKLVQETRRDWYIECTKKKERVTYMSLSFEHFLLTLKEKFWSLYTPWEQKESAVCLPGSRRVAGLVGIWLSLRLGPPAGIRAGVDIRPIGCSLRPLRRVLRLRGCPWLG